MSKDTSNKGIKRTRNYATTVWPDSAPQNWQEILAEQFVPAFISPLHDKDINPTGEPKKAHWHVVIMFEGPKTKEQAQELFDKIGGVGCEVLQSLRGYARYLCHLDNPEKTQYDTNEVRSLCGADYIGVIGLAVDKQKALDEMMDFCEEYDVTSFYALAKYARVYRSDWARVLKDCGTIYMREYLKSRQWSIDNNKTHVVDPKTGEIIV